MQVFDNYRPGDRVRWNSISGPLEGTIIDEDFRGLLVACDGGGQVYLTTTQSYKNFINRRKQ